MLTSILDFQKCQTPVKRQNKVMTKKDKIETAFL